MNIAVNAPKKELSLFDSTCLIVGIIIGAGIYQAAPDVAKGAGCWWGVLLIWIIGGLLSLFGALGYAELASAYPKAGGDYIYLSRAYGPWAGFLFGWVQLAIVRPGDIAVMAFVFATYASQLWAPFGSASHLFFAGLAIVLLTGLNIFGVRESKFAQNLLTTVKALGLLAIFFVAIAAPAAEPLSGGVESFPLSVAMILVLFTYGGWNEMAYVAAEVKDPQRNITRALVVGTVAVIVLYLLANGAFLYTLGYEGFTRSHAVAADTISKVFPVFGARMISALICVSAFGAVNGLIFAGARISYALGADYGMFRYLGRWDARTGTPIRALALQGVIAMALVILLGSFKATILYTAATVYSFYLATNAAVIVLRRKEPDVPRPYKVTGYPFTTIIFCAVCAFLIYSAVAYRPVLCTIPAGILLLGIPIYRLTSQSRASER